jgi:hypothetical protein
MWKAFGWRKFDRPETGPIPNTIPMGADIICLWAKQCLFLPLKINFGNFVTIYYVFLMIRGMVYDIVSPTLDGVAHG